MDRVKIEILRLDGGDGLPLPAYMSEGASGMDIHAAVVEETVIAPGSFGFVPTGFSIAVPEGYEAQVRPRSGLALRCGVFVLNTPGTIDSDYRGEVGVILANLGSEPFRIERGDRIAQLVISRVERAVWVETEELEETARQAGGFGHTGAGRERA